jgi:TolA-binding protein
MLAAAGCSTVSNLLATTKACEERAEAGQAESAKMLYNVGFALNKQGDTRGAITAYDELDRRFGKDASPAIRQVVAIALFHKGFILSKQGKTKAATAVYDDIDQRFGRDKAPDTQEVVAKVLIRKGTVLMKASKDKDKAIAVFDLVDQRYGGSASPNVRKQVAWALYYRAVVVGERSAVRKAAILDQIIRRFGQDDDSGTRDLLKHVAKVRASIKVS